MTILEKLHRLGETLPPAPPPGGNYLPFRKVGSLVFLAGAISVRAGVVTTGKVGLDRSVEEGYEAAKLCVLNHLAVINAAFGSLEVVQQVVTVNGYVNSTPDFPDPPLVINGASDLLVALFGEAGRHARAAVGVTTLPRTALVEVQMTIELVEGK